jgi:hypothetical protein
VLLMLGRRQGISWKVYRKHTHHRAEPQRQSQLLEAGSNEHMVGPACVQVVFVIWPACSMLCGKICAKWVGDSAACADERLTCIISAPTFSRDHHWRGKWALDCEGPIETMTNDKNANRTSLSTHYWTDDAPFLPPVLLPSGMLVKSTNDTAVEHTTSDISQGSKQRLSPKHAGVKRRNPLWQSEHVSSIASKAS